MASVEEYWIGKGIDVKSIWNAFDRGRGYEDKYKSMRVHLLRIRFEKPQQHLPLFSHEAIFKTVKAYFHELKSVCLSHDEYAVAGPLFLYEVNRQSAEYTWLGELRQLLLFGTTLADEKLVGQQIDNLDRKLSFLRNHFDLSAIREEDFRAFMRARTQPEMERAVFNLFGHGIRSVGVSSDPFTGDPAAAHRTLVELGTGREDVTRGS